MPSALHRLRQEEAPAPVKPVDAPRKFFLGTTESSSYEASRPPLFVPLPLATAPRPQSKV
jgi:hypothetical protein